MTGALFHNATGGHVRRMCRTRRSARLNGTGSCGVQSRSFALVADLTVAMLGGGLKTKQKLTGRLADALSELYLTVLRAEALRG